MDRKEGDMESESNVRTMSTINLILGAWFIVSPWLLGYTSSAAIWNQFVVGIVIALLAIGRMIFPNQRWMSVTSGVAALWAIIAPFILSYNKTAAYWNEIVVAIVVAIIAFGNSAVTVNDRMHHTNA